MKKIEAIFVFLRHFEFRLLGGGGIYDAGSCFGFIFEEFSYRLSTA